MSDNFELKGKFHSFNAYEAVKLNSVFKAIMLQNFRFWLDKESANEEKIHDGYPWTYNTARAYCKLWPYMKESQIRRLLKEMVEDGVLIVGNYNKNKYDHTNWYTMPEYALEPLVSLNDKIAIIEGSKNEENSELNGNALEPPETPMIEKSIIGDRKIDHRRSDNRSPIPVIKPVKNTDTKTPHVRNRLFENFWSKMKLGKHNKQKAKWHFDRLYKSERNPEKFFEGLIEDTLIRHANNQLGFNKLHPTSYLKDRRWEDDYSMGKGEDLSRDDTDWHKNPGRTFG